MTAFSRTITAPRSAGCFGETGPARHGTTSSRARPPAGKQETEISTTNLPVGIQVPSGARNDRSPARQQRAQVRAIHLAIFEDVAKTLALIKYAVRIDVRSGTLRDFTRVRNPVLVAISRTDQNRLEIWGAVCIAVRARCPVVAPAVHEARAPGERHAAAAAVCEC